jgi:serine O-acetyltransferase
MGENLTADQLWQSIRSEAEAIVARDPVFGASLYAGILEHAGLGSALARKIGERLGTTADESQRFARIATEAFAACPELIEAASLDLQSVAVNDPATKSLLPPFVNYKGYVALQAWRLSNWLWRRGQTDLALLMQSASSDQLAVSIHPSASIGTSVFIDHGTGVIVGAHAVIGDGVTILQNVTIGRRLSRPDLAPRIGRGVFLSSGATILGGVTIGDDARIGADAVVEHDVPAGCTAVGVPARLTNCPEPAFA